MSSYFKNPVQDIEKDHPHLVDQFIVLSREGHREAANKLIDDYTRRYTDRLTAAVNKVNLNFDSEDREFGTDDAVNILIELGKDYLNGYHSVSTEDKDLNAIDALTDITYDEYMALSNQWDREATRRGLEGNAEQQQRPPAILHLQNKLKVLSEFYSKAKENLATVVEGEANHNEDTIPSAGRCSIM